MDEAQVTDPPTAGRRPYGATKADALAIIDDVGHITSSELTRRTGVKSAAAGYALKTLEAEGTIVVTEKIGNALVYGRADTIDLRDDVPIRQIRDKRNVDARIADAVKVLSPKGLGGIDPMDFLQWIDMTKAVFGG